MKWVSSLHRWIFSGCKYLFLGS